MVTELSTVNNFPRELFQAEIQNDAAWLERIRESAYDRFVEVGFPTVRDEEWKYTNVAPLAKAKFAPASVSTLSSDDAKKFAYPETSQSQLVFVNGVPRLDLSSLAALPKELVVLSLTDAISDNRFAEQLQSHLGRHADYIANSFTALNTAFASVGAFIFVPGGLQVTQPVHVLFLSDSRENPVASFPRLLVVAEQGSRLSLIESYASVTDSAYFTNVVAEISLADNAQLEHYRVQREGREAFHIATTSVTLARHSRYDTTNINLGAGLSRHDMQVRMDEEGAECTVDGLYLVGDGQHHDTHSVIDHRKPHCTSHQLYKGILDGKSRAVFNGKIFVRHDAQKTDAMQTNKNLLLSNEARVDTKPQLEILADDVKCAHGAAVGQIDEEEMFYLETRGIHPELARNLLTYGFAEEVINKIKIGSIKSQLDDAVLRRLQTRLEV